MKYTKMNLIFIIPLLFFVNSCKPCPEPEPIEVLITLQNEIIENIIGKNIVGFYQESFNSSTIGSLYSGNLVSVTNVDKKCLEDNIIITDIGTISASKKGVFSKNANLNLLASTASVLSSINFSYEKIATYRLLIELKNIKYQKINDLTKYESCVKLDGITSYAYGVVVGELTFDLSALNSESKNVEFDFDIIKDIQSDFEFQTSNSTHTKIRFFSKKSIVIGVAKKNR